MKHRKTNKILRAVLCDLLLVALMLCSYAAFHHVIPILKAERAAAQAVAERQNAAQCAPASPSPAEETAAPGDSAPAEAAAPEATPEPTPDTRTEWQIKFADRFTDEVILTENTYSSPTVSVTVTKYETEITGYGYGYWPCIYYVADIYVASLENFRTYTANNRLDRYVSVPMADMDAESNALLSLSGDFFCYQAYGFIVRNGQTFINNASCNPICVLFNDGTMETYEAYKYDIAALEEKGVYQAWSFGPALLDSEGHAIRSAASTVPAVNQQNPRSAIGYYEPGHYCFVMVEGRDNNSSKGMIFAMLADLFESLGCTRAYNLDGGGSAMMYFDHELITTQSNGDRALSDILCIVETGMAVEGPLTD